MRVLKLQLSPGSRSCQARFLWQLTQERKMTKTMMMMMMMMMMMTTISQHPGRQTPNHTTPRGGRGNQPLGVRGGPAEPGSYIHK